MKKIEGYVLVDVNKKIDLERSMTTMGAIQVFKTESSAEEMAKMCAGKNSLWKPMKVEVIMEEQGVDKVG